MSAKLTRDLVKTSEKLRKERRAAAAKLTRKEKAIQLHLDKKRPSSELSDMFGEYQQMCKELTDIHENYTETLEFDTEEQWMTIRQQDFLMFEMKVKDYIHMNKCRASALRRGLAPRSTTREKKCKEMLLQGKQTLITHHLGWKSHI